MKIAVVGTRKYTDQEKFAEELYKILKPFVDDERPITILSGGAKGVDQMAQRYAASNGYDFVLFKPYHLIDPRSGVRPQVLLH